jgi:hypothetical protein
VRDLWVRWGWEFGDFEGMNGFGIVWRVEAVVFGACGIGRPGVWG